MTAKKLSWIYPGLGHMKIDNKNKGITLLTIETLSLAMAFVSLNNMNTLNDEKTKSDNDEKTKSPSCDVDNNVVGDGESSKTNNKNNTNNNALKYVNVGIDQNLVNGGNFSLMDSISFSINKK